MDIDPRHGGTLEETATGYRILHNGGLVFELPHGRLHRSGGGGWHVIVEHCNLVTQCHEICGDAVELKSSGGYVVLPGSPHTSGHDYAVLHDDPPQPLPVAVLARKGGAYAAQDLPARHRSADRPAASGTDKIKTPEQIKSWCHEGRQWIRRKYRLERIADGQGRNDKLARCGFWLRRQGLSGTDCVRVLAELNHTICDPPLPARRLNGLAARIDAKPAGIGTASEALREIQNAAAHAPWHGHPGLSAYRALMVWCDLAHRMGMVSGLEMSDRRSALAAGFSKRRTAQKARHFLVLSGWLVPEVDGQSRGLNRTSTKYRLQVGAGLQDPPKESRRRSGEAGPIIPLLNADQFTRIRGKARGSIDLTNQHGLVGLEIVTALHAGATYATAAALARAINRKPDTVRDRLKRLVQAGLVVKGRNGWQRGPKALEPTYARRDRLRLLHRAQRLLHHAKLRQRGIAVTTPTPTVSWQELQDAGIRKQHPKLVKELARRNLLVGTVRPLTLVERTAPAPEQPMRMRM